MSGRDGDPMAVAARPMGIFRPAPPHPVSGEARRFGPENALSFPVTDARRPRTISPDPFHPSSPHRRAPCRPASHRAPTATLSLPPHGDSTGSRPDPKPQTVHENGASSERDKPRHLASQVASEPESCLADSDEPSPTCRANHIIEVPSASITRKHPPETRMPTAVSRHRASATATAGHNASVTKVNNVGTVVRIAANHGNGRFMTGLGTLLGYTLSSVKRIYK